MLKPALQKKFHLKSGYVRSKVFYLRESLFAFILFCDFTREITINRDVNNNLSGRHEDPPIGRPERGCIRKKKGLKPTWRKTPQQRKLGPDFREGR